MAEQWQALAGMASSVLALASLHPFGTHLKHASAELGFRRFQMGLLTGGSVVPLQSVYLDDATEMLEKASREMAAYNEILNRAIRAFSIYGGTLGVLTDGPLWHYLDAGPQSADPLWQSWVQHMVDALHRTEQASQRLRTLAAYDLATVDAFTVARSFPENSPSFSAWMRAAEIFAVRAKAEAHAASLSERIMYSAVTGEFLAGWSIFNP